MVATQYVLLNYSLISPSWMTCYRNLRLIRRLSWLMTFSRSLSPRMSSSALNVTPQMQVNSL